MQLHSYENYLEHLEEQSRNHAGYPYNLKYDCSQLLPFLRFSINNLGDPFIESNYKIDSRIFEQEVLAFFAKLYSVHDWWGYIISSGTEGNLYGLLLGRETYPDGILYASEDSHYSVAKAARFFKIPYVIVRSLPNGEIDYGDLQSRLDPKFPVIINLNIGTTFKGAIDNLDLILDALEFRGIQRFYVHCDGALRGMFLPYLNPEAINFNRPIHSLSISGHKFIGCPMPCGVLITREALVEQLFKDIEYIGSKDTTIGGSRNGHAPLFLHHTIRQRQHLFEEEVLSCVKKAEYLYDKFEHLGDCLLNPCSTTVVFPTPTSVTAIKWQLATQGRLAHAVVMQNHDDVFLARFAREVVDNQVNRLAC